MIPITNGDIVVENPIPVMMQQGPNRTKPALNDTESEQKTENKTPFACAHQLINEELKRCI